MITKILLPLKFSAGDGNALGMALKMAKRFESCLHVLHYRLHSPSLTDAQVAQFCRDAEKKFQEKYNAEKGNYLKYAQQTARDIPVIAQPLVSLATAEIVNDVEKIGGVTH